MIVLLITQCPESLLTPLSGDTLQKVMAFFTQKGLISGVGSRNSSNILNFTASYNFDEFFESLAKRQRMLLSLQLTSSSTISCNAASDRPSAPSLSTNIAVSSALSSLMQVLYGFPTIAADSEPKTSAVKISAFEAFKKVFCERAALVSARDVARVLCEWAVVDAAHNSGLGKESTSISIPSKNCESFDYKVFIASCLQPSVGARSLRAGFLTPSCPM